MARHVASRNVDVGELTRGVFHRREPGRITCQQLIRCGRDSLDRCAFVTGSRRAR
jgi:hypothetical protein